MKIQPDKATPTKQLSPVLARLMEEVRNNKSTIGGSYDRTHNRHNRGQ
jgi:hypothetical protein